MRLDECKNDIDVILAGQRDKSYIYIGPGNMENGLTVYAYGGVLISLFIENEETIFELYSEDYHEYMENGAVVYDEYKKIDCKNREQVVSFYKNYLNAIMEGIKNWSEGNRASLDDDTFPRLERRREMEIARRNNKLSCDNIAIVAVERTIKLCHGDGSETTAKPDLIGAYVNKEGKLVFQYIEYKCTPKGNTGTSLKKHFRDMYEYLDDVDLKSKVLKYVREMIGLGYISADADCLELIQSVQLDQILTEIGFLFSHMKKAYTKSPTGNENEYVSEYGLRTKYKELQDYINNADNKEVKDNTKERIKYVFLNDEYDVAEVERMLTTVSEWDNNKWIL